MRNIDSIGINLDHEEVCQHCEGRGIRIVEDAQGGRTAESCICREQSRGRRMVARAHIPRRYEHCTLDNYETSFAGATPSLVRALILAKKFVEAYPLETDGIGLLLTGSIGVGKTHLASAILRSLIEQRGAKGLFCDYRELLKKIQNSYNPGSASTEYEVLAPVFEAEVLVLDEIGATKLSDWVWDTVALILNTRYNDKRTTIITTNYANLPPLGMSTGDDSPRKFSAVLREETLGDRIGERMRSRLQEMCVAVEMRGDDFRQKVKRASFL